MPLVRQQLTDATGRLRRQPLKYVADVGVGIESVELGRVDQAHHRCSALARTQAAGEQPVLPPDGDRPDAVLDPVVVDRQVTIVDVARQCRPAVQAVVDRPGGDLADDLYGSCAQDLDPSEAVQRFFFAMGPRWTASAADRSVGQQSQGAH